jgi:hypothetical protein
MKTDVSMPPPEDFSLVLGGPLYQMYLRSRLVRAPLDLIERRVAAVIIVTWFPLLGLTLAGGHALSGVTVPFLFDLDVHIRFLLALPLLIGAELLVHQRLPVTVRQFIPRGIIAPEDRPQFDGIIAATMRLRNSAAIEIVLSWPRSRSATGSGARACPCTSAAGTSRSGRRGPSASR